MNRLKFSIKPNLKIKEFKNLIVKFKKIKIITNNIKWDYFSNFANQNFYSKI